MGRRMKILEYAALSIFVTAILAFSWEFLLELNGTLPRDFVHVGESDASRWTHVAVITMFAAISVTIVSVFAQRLLNELKAKERTLEQAEEERLSFAADTAHELRTPLAILRAHIDSFDANDGQDAMAQLRGDVDQITRIVEQVLAKSRIEALGVKPGDKADLARICQDMAAYMAPLVIKEGRTIEVLGTVKPCIVNGNAFAVEQALRNLVENAIKYSARGSTITLEVGEGRREYLLRVTDRGRGVPKGERELIFERFRRADRRGSGAGLGLSIVRRVAEAHGGLVTVEDAPGGGAVFTLLFPRR